MKNVNANVFVDGFLGFERDWDRIGIFFVNERIL